MRSLTRRTVRLLCLILAVLHDAVRLQYTENPGAFLGLGGIAPLRTGIFNLADVALVLGLALILPGHRRTSSPAPV